MVSEMGFGAFGISGARFGDSYGPTDDGESVLAIHRAIDRGCTFFDTADAYGKGHSESLIGAALQARGTKEIVVATKGGCHLDQDGCQDFSLEYLERAVEASLRRLRRERIDLYQLHNPPIGLLRDGTVFETLAALRVSGKVRYAGVSVHTVEEGLECLRYPVCSSIQIVHNMFSLVRNGEPFDELFGAATAKGVGIIAREPLANGYLAGRAADAPIGPGDVRAELSADARRVRASLARLIHGGVQQAPTPAQIALRFVLDNPYVSTTIVGVKTTPQVDENFAAVLLPSFDELYARHLAPAQNAPRKHPVLDVEFGRGCIVP